jgi:hypothetical protein
VYADQKPCGEIFYVGKGTNKRLQHARRNRLHARICKKYPDWTRCTVAGNVTEQEAFALEKALITKVGRRDLGTGTLVNLTDGGEGKSGCTFSPEALAKMSAAKKGKTLTTEHRAKIGAARVGRSLTDEERDRMSAIQVESWARRKASRLGAPSSA